MAQRLIRLPQVQLKTGLARATIYLRIAQGTFPNSIPLDGRSVAWIESEVDEWVEQRIRAARGDRFTVPQSA
jgi:prophage regulatory protein